MDKNIQYADKLKTLVNEKIFFVRGDSLNQVQIFAIFNQMIDQEDYFELRCMEDVFTIYTVSRGQAREVASFHEVKYAYLFLGLLVSKSFKSRLNPMPDDISDFFEEKGDNLQYLKNMISKYINSKCFSILSQKDNAICLMKDKKYIVYFKDWEGIWNVISDDNKEFGMGLQVMCNYAWTLQWIWELIKGWEVSFDDKEFLYAIKLVLNVQQS